ncbi:sensor histidine kinase [Azospirillum doebereinerae]
MKRADPPMWTEKQLRTAIDAAGVSLWLWQVDTDEIVMDERGYDLWGIPRSETVTFEHLSATIHPEDLDKVRAAFTATRAVFGAYEIDFRILFGNKIRWISARGQGNDAGMLDRVMAGIFLDVTQRKQAEEANELLSGEMSHRVKNLLQVASTLTLITSRSATTTEEMTQDLMDRLMSLGRAHDLVRPFPGQEKRAALLGDMLAVLLAPYDNRVTSTERVRVSVPKMSVGEAAATTLALIVHELATNSLKYGALSTPTGTIDVSCDAYADEADVVIIWAERGGPPVLVPMARAGFGSKMVARSMSDALDGSIVFDWAQEGLVVTLRMSKDRLAG